MSDVIEYLERDELSKMENIIQKMSQIVKYVVLTVFEFRSCTNYMKQMKIENDFEFYDLLQHVTPRANDPYGLENIRSQKFKG